MSRITFLLCAVVLFVNAARAGECDYAHPGFYKPAYACQREFPGGPCALTRQVTFEVVAFYPQSSPITCATTAWSFGDGAHVTSTGVTTWAHMYAQAGQYNVTARITTANSTDARLMTFSFVVANGMTIAGDDVIEGQPGRIQFTRTNVKDPIQVQWNLIPDSGGVTPPDTSPASGVASFAAGQATVIVRIQTLRDGKYVHARETRKYKVAVGSITGGFVPTSGAFFTIRDPDYPVVDFAQKTMEVMESSAPLPVQVVRVGGDPNAPFTVQYHLSYGSEKAVSTSGTLVFAPGQMTQSFLLTRIDDTAYLGEGWLNVELRYFTDGGRSPGGYHYSTLRIIVSDDDPIPHVTVADITVAEGDEGVKDVFITLRAPRPMQDCVHWEVSGTAVHDIDYRSLSDRGYISFYPTAYAELHMQIVGDRETEHDEQISLSLTSCHGHATVDSPVTVTIVNDDAWLAPNQLPIRRGASSSILMNIGLPAEGPLIVPLSTTRPDLVQIPATITVPAGQRRARFDATGLIADRPFLITAGLPADRGGPQSITGWVYEPIAVAFDPAVVNVDEGREVAVRVSLTPDQSMRELALHVADPGLARAPNGVTVDRGSGTFTVRGLKAGTTIITTVNPDGSDAESVLEVNVTPDESPALASVSPATGPAVGGTSFVASGAHVTGNCTLSFGGVPVAAVTLADGTLSGVTPAHAAGTVDVALTCASRHFVLTNAFTYVAAPPVLASITPAFGSTAGGTLVHATGSNFQSGCWMFFGDTPAAAVDVDSTTSLTAVTPPRASAEAVDAIVRCGGASSLPASFAYSSAAEPLASIISIDPIIGAPGDSVTVTGSRFRGDDRFRFDEVNATVLRTRANEHVLRVPELPLGMTSILFTDFTGRTTTTGPVFLVLAASPPSVTSIEPANTLPGSEITLIGTGFRPAYSFAIGGRATEIISLTSERAIVRLPDDVAPGMHPVHVLNAAGRIASIGAAVIVGSSPLRIHGAFPECGTTDGGTVVTITGLDFAPGATVTFNGVAATNIEFITPNTLRATTPAGPTGPATLVVTNPDAATATITTAYRFVSPFDPNGGCGGGRQRGVRK